MRWTALVAQGAVLALVAGCGGAAGETRRTYVERTPYGTRTVTVTTRTVPAPDPPARPGDPLPKDELVRYNLELLNGYRARAGIGPLVYDTNISAFAWNGSVRLSRDHRPHAHFAERAQSSAVFGTRSAENQGDPRGVPPLDPQPLQNGKKQVAVMMKLMMDEGPGGGHHDNMLNPRYRRVGIGLLTTAEGRLYLTNDFSN